MVNDGLSINGLGGEYQSRYLTNNYANMAGMDAGSFGDAPLLSFGNQGAYGQDCGMGMMGGMMNPMMGGMGMMNPMMGGMGYCQDPTAMINYQKKMSAASMQMQEEMEQFQIAKQVRQQKMYKTAEFATSSPETQVMEKIDVLKKLVDANEQNLIPGAHDELVKAVKDLYPVSAYATPTEKAAYSDTIKATANKLYTAKTGKELGVHLKDRGNSEIGQGFGEGLLGIGFLAKNKNYKDSLYHTTGQEISRSDDVSRWTGRILGAGATIAALVLLGKHGDKAAHEIGNVFSRMKINRAEGALADFKVAGKLAKSKTIKADSKALEQAVKEANAAYYQRKADYALKYATKQMASV